MTPASLMRDGWVRGIDVSDNNGAIDWAKVYAEGVRYVYVKLTEGETFSAKRGCELAAAAQAAGLLVGGYHFARPDNGNDPVEEAENFAAELFVAGESVVNGLPPLLDYEVKGGSAAWVETFVANIEGMLGVTPWYYSGLHTYLNLAPGRCGRMVAAYTAELPWPSRYEAWQYSGDGLLQGVRGRVDLSIMRPDVWAGLTKGK